MIALLAAVVGLLIGYMVGRARQRTRDIRVIAAAAEGGYMHQADADVAVHRIMYD